VFNAGYDCLKFTNFFLFSNKELEHGFIAMRYEAPCGGAMS
jgi:hypothetical protein